MRLQEINERLAAIQNELETATGDALTALENEVAELTAERTRLMDEINTRRQLRQNIAAGTQPGVTVSEIGAEESKTSRTFSKDSAEYREAYLMNLQGRRLTMEQRTAVTATSAIPTVTLDRIIARLDDSPVLSRVDLMRIPGNVSIPVEKTVNDVSWVAMGTAATDAADELETVSLSAYKLIKTVEITADVEAMGIDAFENWLVDRLANKMANALDAAVLNGTGSSQAKGIVTELSESAKEFTEGGLTYADLLTIIGSLGTEYAQNAVFIMPRALFYSDVMGIVGSDGNPIVHADVESPAKFSLLGYPVIVDDKVPKDNILFGDLFAYKLNLAKEPEVRSDDSVAFRSGSRVYRVMALADGKLAEKSAFVLFKRKASEAA